MNTILAVDLGKYNSVLCWYEPDTRSAAYLTVATTPDDLRRALTRRPVARVVFEACSQAGRAHDLCEELRLPAVAASTAGDAWRWNRVKRKTDRDDALKLARLAAVGELDAVAVPDRATRQWKSLIGLRKRLVSERVRGQNRIRGLLVCQGLPAPAGARAWTELGLAGIGQLARPLVDCPAEELWRGEPHVLLDRLRSLDARAREVEAKLDALAKGDIRPLVEGVTS
jgi:transposase